MNMRPRAVDWTLFALISFELFSGFFSFTVGRPEGRPLFVIHGIVGLTILLLLFFKFRRVHRRITEPRRWQRATLISILLSLAALASAITGIVWTTLQRPVDYPNGMILHTTAGIVLAVLYLWHMWLRYKPLSRRDVTDRRTALTALGVLLAGGAAWVTQDSATQRFKLPGAERRFTGSRHVGSGQGNGAFPITMWMFDRPAPLDLAQYRLSVDGLVNIRQVYDLQQLSDLPHDEVNATIDCTGGWYSTQTWQGIRIGDLLASAKPNSTARYVTFVSSTGYRWSLPIAEAADALLATHVGGELLSHGHGAPLRLVAPGRRGFQWVKWVVQISVSDRVDWGQWQAIFTSGIQRGDNGQES